MIICSCNIVTRADIEEAVTGFLDEDPWRLITPGKVFHELSQRGKCCGCFPGVINIIVQTTQRYHVLKESPSVQVIELLDRIAMQRERVDAARQRRAAKNHWNTAA